MITKRQLQRDIESLNELYDSLASLQAETRNELILLKNEYASTKAALDNLVLHKRNKEVPDIQQIVDEWLNGKH